MTGKQRFLTALQGKKPDRAPLAHVAALTNTELQTRTGCFMPAAHLEAEKLFGLCAANHEELGFDAVTFIINYFNEPAALGCRMDWGQPDRLPVYTSHPWERAEDARVPGDLLQRKPVATYLSALEMAVDRYGDKIGVIGKVMGPLSMVQVMHGVERTMMGLIESPDLVRGLMETAADILVSCANAQFDRGIDALSIGEGGAGANMLSPGMYTDQLLDIHQRMVSRIDGPTILHMCGDIRPRLSSLSQVGLSCFNFDWAIDPQVMRAKAEGFSIMGNINTGDLLQADPEVIEAQVFDNLEAGVDIIAPGCAVSPLCPTQNLKAMRRAIDRWYQNRSVDI